MQPTTTTACRPWSLSVARQSLASSQRRRRRPCSPRPRPCRIGTETQPPATGSPWRPPMPTALPAPSPEIESPPTAALPPRPRTTARNCEDQRSSSKQSVAQIGRRPSHPSPPPSQLRSDNTRSTQRRVNRQTRTSTNCPAAGDEAVGRTMGRNSSRVAGNNARLRRPARRQWCFWESFVEAQRRGRPASSLRCFR